MDPKNENNNAEQKGDAQTAKPSPVELELQKKLTALDTVVGKLTEQAKLGESLQNDPEFQEFLKLKASGKKVAVAERQERFVNPLDELMNLADKADEDEGDEGEGKSKKRPDTKDLLSTLGAKLPEIMKSAIEQSTRPLLEKVSRLEQGLVASKANEERAALEREVEDVAQRYPDAAIYQKDMATLSEEIAKRGSLTVEQLYQLAKLSKIGMPDRSLESEYPTTILSSRTVPIPEKPRPGVSGFNSILSEVLNRKYSR